MTHKNHGASRRAFLRGSGALGRRRRRRPWVTRVQQAEAARRNNAHRSKDIQTTPEALGGARTLCFVRVITSDGRYGIGRRPMARPAWPGAEQILSLKPQLVRQESAGDRQALHLYGQRARRAMAGTRTDASAHNLMQAASGARDGAWDLAGTDSEHTDLGPVGRPVPRPRAGLRPFPSARHVRPSTRNGLTRCTRIPAASPRTRWTFPAPSRGPMVETSKRPPQYRLGSCFRYRFRA